VAEHNHGGDAFEAFLHGVVLVVKISEVLKYLLCSEKVKVGGANPLRLLKTK
jgi:hypothetical protein